MLLKHAKFVLALELDCPFDLELLHFEKVENWFCRVGHFKFKQDLHEEEEGLDLDELLGLVQVLENYFKVHKCLA